MYKIQDTFQLLSWQPSVKSQRLIITLEGITDAWALPES